MEIHCFYHRCFCILSVISFVLYLDKEFYGTCKINANVTVISLLCIDNSTTIFYQSVFSLHSILWASVSSLSIYQ